MDKRSIKYLVDLMEKSGLSVLDIKEGDFQIHMEKGGAQAGIITHAESNSNAMAAPGQETIISNIIDDGVVDLNNVKEVKSQIVGVFYAAAKPGAEPFVRRGQKVKKGDVLCIIEAMKLMNEIVSDFDGEIVDICVENGQMVEFGQVLFKIY